jgi:two-component system response regulator NreC
MEIILVDPSTIFRMGLKAALTEAPGAKDIHVVAECADRASGARLAAQLAPGVVISELQLGDDNGIQLARELARTVPAVRLMILASRAPEALVHQAIAAGAVGYLLKQDPPAQVLAALEKVRRGERVLPAGISEPSRSGARMSERGPGLERLSRREREVFDLVVMGSANRAIAQRLGISPKTVETHRGHINRKLSVHTTADIVRLASFWGLLVPACIQHSTDARNGAPPQ